MLTRLVGLVAHFYQLYIVRPCVVEECLRELTFPLADAFLDSPYNEMSVACAIEMLGVAGRKLKAGRHFYVDETVNKLTVVSQASSPNSRKMIVNLTKLRNNGYIEQEVEVLRQDAGCCGGKCRQEIALLTRQLDTLTRQLNTLTRQHDSVTRENALFREELDVLKEQNLKLKDQNLKLMEQNLKLTEILLRRELE